MGFDPLPWPGDGEDVFFSLCACLRVSELEHSSDQHRNWIAGPLRCQRGHLLASFIQSISSALCTRWYREFYSCDTHNTCPILFPSLKEFSQWCGHRFCCLSALLYQTDDISRMGVVSTDYACRGLRPSALDG